MTDPILNPLDPVYARHDFLRDKDAKKKKKILERNLKHNAERRKRIAKCWNCGYFDNHNCADPAHCRKERHE